MRKMLDVKWKDAVKKSAHYLAVGQSDIYLYGDSGDYPWEYAVSAEAGCTHRIDIATSISFKAQHPSGLSFRWSFDIEGRNANGASTYEIDAKAVAAMMSKVPTKVRTQLTKYFETCADAVEKHANTYLEAANRQFGDARILRSFANQ
jgi:hypothetical protein